MHLTVNSLTRECVNNGTSKVHRNFLRNNGERNKEKKQYDFYSFHVHCKNEEERYNCMGILRSLSPFTSPCILRLSVAYNRIDEPKRTLADATPVG